jgi:hypothetical protein
LLSVTQFGSAPQAERSDEHVVFSTVFSQLPQGPASPPPSSLGGGPEPLSFLVPLSSPPLELELELELEFEFELFEYVSPESVPPSSLPLMPLAQAAIAAVSFEQLPALMET